MLAFLPASADIGIITYNVDKLNFKHLEQLGVPTTAHKRVRIVGPPADGYLQNLVRGKGPYDQEGLTSEIVSVAKGLVSAAPATRAIVLECTQLPPFAEAIQRALDGKVAVYDAHTMGCWFYSGLVSKKPEYWK